MDLGPHAAFIWISYAAALIVLAGLAGWLVLEGRNRSARLAELESRGIRRRSSGGES
jgi:heme exporter protein D